MSLPGFTADASIYNTNQHYRKSPTGSYFDKQVVPQIFGNVSPHSFAIESQGSISNFGQSSSFGFPFLLCLFGCARGYENCLERAAMIGGPAGAAIAARCNRNVIRCAVSCLLV